MCSDIWGNYPILIFLNKIFLYLFNYPRSPWPPPLNTCGHIFSLQSPNLPTATPDTWLWIHRANSFSTNFPISSSFVIYMLGLFGFSCSPWLFTHIVNWLVTYVVVQLCPTLCDPMDCSMPGFSVLHFLPEFAQTHVHGVWNLLIEPIWGICLFICFSIEA